MFVLSFVGPVGQRLGNFIEETFYLGIFGESWGLGEGEGKDDGDHGMNGDMDFSLTYHRGFCFPFILFHSQFG